VILDTSVTTTADTAGCGSEIEYWLPRKTSLEKSPQVEALIVTRDVEYRLRAWLCGYMYIGC
jgi:hypothetical protein